MLKKWTQTNKQWFAPDSRLSKAQWSQLIIDGCVQGKIIGGIPFIEEDHIAGNIILDQTPANDSLDLLG